MAKRRLFPKSRGLTLDHQIFRMQCVHPDFRVTSHRRQHSVMWIGRIKPAPISDEYNVSIMLKPGLRPVVQVLQPELQIREGATCLPHFYTRDNSLCLHELHEWKDTRFVAYDIVPWASLWLYFYEIWRITGSWEGGGTHPDKLEHQSSEEKVR
jgi:hypothetical protein